MNLFECHSISILLTSDQIQIMIQHPACISIYMLKYVWTDSSRVLILMQYLTKILRQVFRLLEITSYQLSRCLIRNQGAGHYDCCNEQLYF